MDFPLRKMLCKVQMTGPMVVEKSTYLTSTLLSPLPCEASVVHHWLKLIQGSGKSLIFFISTQVTPFGEKKN